MHASPSIKVALSFSFGARPVPGTMVRCPHRELERIAGGETGLMLLMGSRAPAALEAIQQVTK